MNASTMDTEYSEVDAVEDFTINENICYGPATSGTAEVSAANVTNDFNNNICGQRCETTEISAVDVMAGSDNIKSARLSEKHACSKIALVILSIIVIALLLALVGACIAFSTKISSIKSETASSQVASAQYAKNIELLNVSIESIKSSLRNVPVSIENINVSSCAALTPSSPSGYYWVWASNGSAVRVYCDMTRSCGGLTGGWMRVAVLDMTKSGQVCPTGLERINALYCRRIATDRGCSSVHFPSYRQSYTHICGRILGRQIDTPDAFESQDIFNGTYIDGVGLTYGTFRQHIWSFTGAQDASGCRCNNANSGRPLPPPEVGDNYFCDSGILWNGECQIPGTCCSFNNPPWFYRQLSKPTTDDIEMRVCRDRDRNDEDIHIQITEIYIR